MWSALPNTISIARLLLVPVVVYALITHAHAVAFAAFVLAGLSDAVDGLIARRFAAQSEIGAYLDPLADKTLMISVFVTLGLLERVPVWFVVLAVSRDILIIGGVILASMLARPLMIRPLAVSKANTVGQIALASAILAAPLLPGLLTGLTESLTLVAGALTACSALAYVLAWARHMAGPGLGTAEPHDP